MRNEHVVENDHGFLAGELGVAGIEVTAFHGARVAGLPAIDVGDALGIDRNRADDGIVAILLAQPMVGITTIQCELMQPVWCALAPLM